jgi:hypothetical protein
MRFGIFWLALPLLCIACGCQNTGGRPAGELSRVIIGFDPTLRTPDPELLALLGRDLGCELDLQQAIGGNAYVYNCATTDDETVLTRKLNGLGRHKGVLYAEIDRKRKIQN